MFSLVVLIPKENRKTTNKTTIALRVMSICSVVDALVNDLAKVWEPR
jgi:hypothetical protein